MKDTILFKISIEINNVINTEPKALYLLAEIRKFIEEYYQEEKNNYPNLYFYCNWVLHIKMDRTPAKRILKRFEQNILDTHNLDEIASIIKKQERNFYSFVYLKEELHRFLLENNLPDELVKNNNTWFKFKKLLIEILTDCPLVNIGGRVSKFAYERGNDNQIRFRVDINKIKRLGSFKVTLKEK